MARIEKNAPLEEKLQQMKGDMTKEVRHRMHRPRPWLTCSLVALAVLGGLIVWALWTVAATGLVQIPVFTSLAYEPPSPTRTVAAGVPVETVLQEQFTSTLTRRLYEGDGSLTDRTVEARIQESSLTASVRSVLEEAQVSWIDASSSQVAIDPTGVEVFIPFAQDQQLHSAITMTFDLAAQEGQLVVTPTRMVIGRAHVPDLLISLFLTPFIEAELARLNSQWRGYATISSVQAQPQELLIRGELSVELHPQP